jgi:hypothetical protein
MATLTDRLMSNSTGSPPAGRFSKALALSLAMLLIVSLAGCRNPSSVVRLVGGEADDVLRQVESADDASRYVDDIIEDLGQPASSALDDAARAEQVVRQDANGVEALSTACEIATDAATGELPDNASEWFVYLRDIARGFDDAQGLAIDAEEVATIIDGWANNDRDDAELQLALFTFKKAYC